MLAFTCYLVVPLLIPVLTTYPLPLGYMGDILGGGFILGLASFSVAVAAAETGGPYAQLGSSRAMTFGALIEPSILFITFTVALVTTTDLPYFEAAAARASFSQEVRPAHILAALAFFLVVLERHRTHPRRDPRQHPRVRDDRRGPHPRALGAAVRPFEVGVGDEAADPLRDLGRTSSPHPGGWRGRVPLGAVLLAIPILLAKAFGVGAIFTVIDNSFSKLRLFKITEFMAAAFLLAILAVLVLYLGGG